VVFFSVQVDVSGSEEVEDQAAVKWSWRVITSNISFGGKRKQQLAESLSGLASFKEAGLQRLVQSFRGLPLEALQKMKEPQKSRPKLLSKAETLPAPVCDAEALKLRPNGVVNKSLLVGFSCARSLQQDAGAVRHGAQEESAAPAPPAPLAPPAPCISVPCLSSEPQRQRLLSISASSLLQRRGRQKLEIAH